MNLHLSEEGSWSDLDSVGVPRDSSILGPQQSLTLTSLPWSFSMISTHNTHSINHTQSLLDSTARTIIHTPAIHKYHAPISSSLPVTIPQPPNTFDSILASSNLPPPGPDHYAARRALWLTPRFPASSRSLQPSTSRKRLEKVLSAPNAVESNAAWKNGIEDVWKGLSSGGRLKRRLPMSLIVCAATHI
jgi:hypothetical protein